MPDRLPPMAGAASRYLPHGGVAHLIREVTQLSAESLSCTARFPADNALLRDGRAASHLVVEAAAQAAATHLALLAVETGAEISGFEGFLASARHVEILQPDVPADTDFVVHVRPRGTVKRAQPGLFKFRFEAEHDGETIARGELSTYVMPIEA